MESTNFMNLSVNRPGTKVSASSAPELILLPTFNKFAINPAASKKLGWETGDHITIITNEGAEDINNTYFITKGIGEGNQSKLAAIENKPGLGRMLFFNYSGVYSRVLQGTPDAIEASADGLSREGLVQKRTTASGKVAYTALSKIYFKIGDGMEVEINGEDVTIYPLVDMRSEEFVPQSNETEDEE